MLRRIQHLPERTALPAVYGFAGQIPVDSELHTNQLTLLEPRHEKTCIRGFRPGKTQTGLRSHRS